jgi:hypothetical protein
MKKTTLYISLCLTALLAGCIDSPSITGSNDVTEYTTAQFEVTEIIGETTRLTARGIVENTGTTTYYAVWYIEGDFYADNTYDFKLGGDRYSFTFALEPGEKTGWELEFTSSLYTESEYPDFAVKNLRAFTDSN